MRLLISLTAFQTQFAEIFQRDNQLLRLIAEAGLKNMTANWSTYSHTEALSSCSAPSAQQLQAKADIKQTFERQK